MEVRRIKPHVMHQDIGGKEFTVDEGITKDLTNDKVFTMGMVNGNFACYNFIQRRRDFKHDFPHKLYYGKVGGLGYILSEDELEPKEEK